MFDRDIQCFASSLSGRSPLRDVLIQPHRHRRHSHRRRHRTLHCNYDIVSVASSVARERSIRESMRVLIISVTTQTHTYSSPHTHTRQRIAPGLASPPRSAFPATQCAASLIAVVTRARRSALQRLYITAGRRRGAARRAHENETWRWGKTNKLSQEVNKQGGGFGTSAGRTLTHAHTLTADSGFSTVRAQRYNKGLSVMVFPFKLCYCG